MPHHLGGIRSASIAGFRAEVIPPATIEALARGGRDRASGAADVCEALRHAELEAFCCCGPFRTLHLLHLYTC
eukprot:scaffold7485_cov56-Phaeocystis_antarctica.AAC.1